MSFARVQGHHGVDTGTTGAFALAGSAVANGSSICGFATVGSPNVADLLSVTDNQGNTYTLVKVGDAVNNQNYAVFVSINITNAPTTLTLHYTAGLSSVAMVWDEFSGIGAGTLNGQHAQVQASPGVGANTVKTGTTFGSAGDFMYGGTLADSAANTITPGTSPTTFATATNDNADPTLGVSLFSEFGTLAGASDATFGIDINSSMLVGGLAITPAGGVAAQVPYTPWPQLAPILAQ